MKPSVPNANVWRTALDGFDEMRDDYNQGSLVDFTVKLLKTSG